MPTQAKLSRERVLHAALALADSEGIEALTMRRLAQALGVEAMTLYYHVANKDDILDGMVEAVVGEMALPAIDGADWKGELRRASISAHDVLIRHPWAASLLLNGPRVNRARLRQMDAILGCLRGGGFTADMTDHAYHALDSHVTGFTLWQVGISAGLERFGPVADFMESVDTAGMPHLAEHIRQHLRERDPDEPGEFEFGLDLVLDGLERYLAASQASDRSIG